MAKKIVLKIFLVCEKCRVCYMRTVAKLPGITSLALDIEKSTLTVVWEVDPVNIVQELKKVKKASEIMTVGPPDKKEEEKKKPCELPSCCHSCRKYLSSPVLILDDSPPPCTIM